MSSALIEVRRRRVSAKRSAGVSSGARASTPPVSAASGAGATTSVSRPDMPRWTSQSAPSSSAATRYLPRRSTSAMRRPARRAARSGGTGTRSRLSRTSTATTRRPRSTGPSPRTMVSTSGSSGMERAREAREVVERERLRARCRRHARAGERRLEPARVEPAGGRQRRQRVAQHLAPLAEGCAHDGAVGSLVLDRDARLGAPANLDDGRLDPRGRQERPAWHGKGELDVGEALDERRRHAPAAAARGGGQAGSHLALEHHDGAGEAVARLEQPKDDGGGDVVREIGDHRDARIRDDGRERRGEDVGGAHGHVRGGRVAGGEARGEPPIDLDQVEPPRARRELVGERAQPGTDLEHDRFGPHAGALDDATGHRSVAQEVLPPAIAGPQAGGGERRLRRPPLTAHARPTDPSAPGSTQRSPNGSSGSAPSARPSSAPAASRRAPASAIIAALSVQNSNRGKSTSTPASAPSAAIRSRSRVFAETPPETTTRSAPVTASASAVASRSMSTSASCTLAVRSASDSDDGGWVWRWCQTAVLSPLNERSKRPCLIRARGNRTARGLPPRAARWMAGPPG